MIKKIGLVVLNYNNYKDTINCVNSALAMLTPLEIVIVDNGSCNESLNMINKEFSSHMNITVLPLDNNVGYAKGNNAGIKYLIGLGVNYIFVSNPDLIFPNARIFEQMIESTKNGDGVIVPTIKNPDGNNDQRVIYKKKYFFLRMEKELLKHIIKDVLGIKSKSNREYANLPEAKSNCFENSYVVSGSGFMLTPYFFEIYRGLFYETFLYGEECGTIILLNKANLNSRVVNTDSILHIGGSSTPDNIRKMTRQRQKINLDSDIKLLKLLFTSKKSVKKRY